MQLAYFSRDKILRSLFLLYYFFYFNNCNVRILYFYFFFFYTELFVGVGFYLKEKKPEVKVVLADPQVILRMFVCLFICFILYCVVKCIIWP